MSLASTPPVSGSLRTHEADLSPVINDFPCVNDIAEPVLIQTFIAKSSVKALNKFVLHWPARLD